MILQKQKKLILIMKLRKNKCILVLILNFLFLQFHAQEEIRPLNTNINLNYSDLQSKQIYRNDKIKQKASSLNIPFKEDFFYASTSAFPDQLLWSDSSTYVNTGHAIAPPSIGVATFDGLNKKGYPYNPALINMALTYPADTLTSKPINLLTSGAQTLQPSDSVALTFYYQARGFGDAPELIDSLLLDFYNPTAGVWNKNVWFSKGNANSNINDTVFKRAFVMLDSAYYFKDGFKFRFRNKATASGDFDQWHIDYILLDKGRKQIADTVYNDISFAYVPSPLLGRYSAMPWHQYKAEDRANNINVFIRNNSGGNVPNMSYRSSMKQNAVPTYSYDGGAFPNLKRFKYFGYNPHPLHAYPAFTHTFSTFSDSTDFVTKHYLFTDGVTADFFPGNDTVIQTQAFRNYFAYDDGSAEVAYYVSAVGGKMAARYHLNFADTLRAVRIYFDPIGNMQTIETASFHLQIYASSGGAPGLLLLQDSAVSPKYLKKGVNVFPEYKLTSPLLLPAGEYFIGIKQRIATGIGIGFDRNLNHMNYLYYDAGNGWTPSAIPGSIMIRPVFGRKIPPPVGLYEQNNFSADQYYSVYPNPANNIVTVLSNNKQTIRFVLRDMLGKIILEENIFASEHAISTNELSEGIYLLQIISEKNQVHTQKLIIQH